MKSPQESNIWVSENGMGNFNREDDAPGDPGNPRWRGHNLYIIAPQNRLRPARNVDMTAPMDIPLAQT